MVEINAKYVGELRCAAKHEPSSSELHTDAPTDNQGRGESFSPTDLVATGLGTCMMTIMGIIGDRHSIDLTDLKVKVFKEMTANPVRRIAALRVHFTMPRGLSEEARGLLERAALTCPVHASLHPDIEIPVVFDYGD